MVLYGHTQLCRIFGLVKVKNRHPSGVMLFFKRDKNPKRRVKVAPASYSRGLALLIYGQNDIMKQHHTLVDILASDSGSGTLLFLLSD